MSPFKSATLLSLMLISSGVFARTPSDSSRGSSRDSSSASSRDSKSASSHDTDRGKSASSERRPSNNSPRVTTHNVHNSPGFVSAAIHLPSFSFSIGAPPYANARWVDGYHDRHGIWQGGYWRPHEKHGYVWIDGYRDHHGHWQSGYWIRR